VIRAISQNISLISIAICLIWSSNGRSSRMTARFQTHHLCISSIDNISYIIRVKCDWFASFRTQSGCNSTFSDFPGSSMSGQLHGSQVNGKPFSIHIRLTFLIPRLLGSCIVSNSLPLLCLAATWRYTILSTISIKSKAFAPGNVSGL
jgi:hypothetical protein